MKKYIAAFIALWVVGLTFLAPGQDLIINMGKKRVPATHKDRIVAYLDSLDNRRMTTNVVEAVSPPEPTNNWEGITGIVTNRDGLVTGVTNTITIFDPTETQVEKFRRIYYELADKVFLEKIMSVEFAQWRQTNEVQRKQDYPTMKRLLDE